MTSARWRYTTDYLKCVFGKCDAHLQGLMIRAFAAGLPDIAVSPDVGRLLMMLTSMTNARYAVEVGTLAGYSGIWIARGLKPDGTLITIESEDLHADFAERQFEKARLSAQVEIRRGQALRVLPQLVEELGPDSVDVLFFDAIKSEYPAYWKIAKPLLRKGGLLIADNALGSGEWWIDFEDNEHRQGAHALNTALAADPDFEAVAVPLREGVMIARRKEYSNGGV